MRFRTFALVAAVLFAGACEDQGPTSGIDDLEAAMAVWHDFGPASYTYAIQRQCFCGPAAIGPVRVTVVNGAVVSQIYVDTGDPVTGAAQAWFPSVDGLFEILQDALDRDAHEITVTYDPGTGVPTEFSIDYIEHAVDEELGLIVTEAVQATG